MDRLRPFTGVESPDDRSKHVGTILWSDRAAGGLLEIWTGVRNRPRIELGLVRVGNRTWWFWKLDGSERLAWVRPGTT
jgi:hypothetical protein